MLLGFPLLFDILHVFSSVAALLIGVLTLLCEEEMPPNILSGESSGGKYFKLVLEVTPPNDVVGDFTIFLAQTGARKEVTRENYTSRTYF